ncbi:MAG: hypothetical protein ACE5F3_07245 [Mariprofundaceae bacterium]
MTRKLLFSVICLILMTTDVFALSIDLGVSVSQPSLLIRDTATDNVLAEMTDKAAIWPSVSIKTRERYFGETNLGYSASVRAWYMNIDQQKVGGNEVNLGTSAKGYYAYLTPTIYYRFGDKYSMESPDWMGTIGIGVGVGYLNVRGDVVTTGTTPQVRKRIDNVGFGLSSGIFLEVIKQGWFLRITNFGPILMDKGFTLDLRDNSITFGKRFELGSF